ncbi:MAG: GNAT family N-acetyltransferase [Anaerolineales bacterium]|nr:MAG: GNAT family N-acetyltransferase [Anaerolineales bacterium]
MNITIRNFQFDDLPALVAVINRAAEADREETTTIGDLRARLERPYFYPEQNCFVAALPDGEIVGYTTAEIHPSAGLGWGTGCVDPAHRRQNIGRTLIETADMRHLELTKITPDMALSVSRICRDTNESARILYESTGYAICRANWFMHIDFENTFDETQLPDGFGLRAFDRERDARMVWAISGEIFQDSPGFAQPPFEVWENFMFPEGHDDALWLIAVDHQLDDETVAGICLSKPKHNKPNTGWVEPLGVRLAYRKRGLGSALLQRSFYVMHKQGYTAAELSVDAENTSDAVALYQRAGMQADCCYLSYQKVLHGTVQD